MPRDDQTATIAFLGSPSAHAGAAVERVDTHASIVFLAGTRALKLKRAVKYDYLDYSTVEQRREMCEAEVRINRRIAPAIYVGTRRVTRQTGGTLALDGDGPAIDWVVEMVRFDQDQLFDRLAARGRLDLAFMRPLAAAVARFHRSTPARPDKGGSAAMQRVIAGNASGCRDQGAGVLRDEDCARMETGSYEAVRRLEGLLDDRRRAGFVRECHGDLHLRNIVLLAGRPTLFDALEFNDEFSCVDVLYDLAFLLMDLWRRQLPRHANDVLNGYLGASTHEGTRRHEAELPDPRRHEGTGDLEGLRLLPLFLSCRAAVRAKTSATAAAMQSDPARRQEMQQMARDYLAMAIRLLQPVPPCLIAIGGLSGSGKTTLARAVAPEVGAPPGAVLLRSDVVRKELHGARALSRLSADAYTAAASKPVYEELLRRARAVVAAGHAAIVDAVFAEQADREAIERAAAASSVPFAGFWLDAPDATLIERVESRTLDASDADAAVVRLQRSRNMGDIRWARVDASAGREVVAGGALDLLRRDHAISVSRTPRFAAE